MTTHSRTACATGLLLLSLVATPLAAKAQFAYSVANGAITITWYSGPGGAVIIPNEVNGLPVTGIGVNAFEQCASPTSVAIPNTVTGIGYGAFTGCLAVTVDTANAWYSSIDGVLFDKSLATLIEYPGRKSGSYSIPGGVTNIAEQSFRSCSNLTSVTIPNSVTKIGYLAFGECTGLTGVTIPSSVTDLGEAAFEGCSNLTNARIGNGVTSIIDAFSFCTSLTSATIPTSVTNIGYQAFAGSGLTNVAIPDSVTSIGTSAFISCGHLISVTVGSGVNSVGDSAFGGCWSLESVYFQGNAPSADPKAFFGDNYPTVYYLPGTTGWGPFFVNRPAILWNPRLLAGAAGFGMLTNQLDLTIACTNDLTVVVEACTNLADPCWVRLQTVAVTSGSAKSSDPQWTNYPARFYRLRWP